MASTPPGERLSESASALLDDLISNKAVAEIDFETLALAVKAHYESSQDVLELLKERRQLGKDSFYRRLGKFNEVFGQRESKEFFRQLVFLLGVYHNLVKEHETLTIRLGASATLTRFLKPRVVEPFIKWCEENPDRVKFKKVEVEIDGEFPRTLRERGDRGEFDLILTSCPEDFKEGVVDHTRFKMELICGRGHALARRGLSAAEFKEILRGMTLVRLEARPARDPLPDYPKDLLDLAGTVEQVSGYVELHSRVRSSNQIAGFTFPQLLGPEEQQELETVPIPGVVSTVRVCVIRPKKARDWRSAEESLVIDELENRVQRYLGSLGKPLFSEDEIQRLPCDFLAYHVRPIGENLWGWARGRMLLRFTQNGYVKGDHRAEAIDGRKGGQIFGIFGQVLADPMQEFFQIVWQATTGPDEPRSETYVANVICRSGPLRTGYFVGTWAGRASYDTRMYRPASGYLVIRPIDQPEIKDAGELSVIVRAHEKEFGPLGLEQPRDWTNLNGRIPED